MKTEQQIKDFITELTRITNSWTDTVLKDEGRNRDDAFIGFTWDCILGTALFNLSLDIQYDMDMIESYYYKNAQNIIYTIKNTK